MLLSPITHVETSVAIWYLQKVSPHYIYHIPLTWKEATAAQEEATQLQKLLRQYNWQQKQIPIYINWVAYVKFCKSTLKSQMQYSTEL